MSARRLRKSAFTERALGHFAGGLVLGDLAAGGVVAIGGVPQEDDAQHGHAVFAGGQLGVGAQIVGGLPEKLSSQLLQTFRVIAASWLARAKV